jgi:hypothetical protein
VVRPSLFTERSANLLSEKGGKAYENFAKGIDNFNNYYSIRGIFRTAGNIKPPTA